MPLLPCWLPLLRFVERRAGVDWSQVAQKPFSLGVFSLNAQMTGHLSITAIDLQTLNKVFGHPTTLQLRLRKEAFKGYGFADT